MNNRVYIKIPTTCPICNRQTKIVENTDKNRTVKVLTCTNDDLTE